MRPKLILCIAATAMMAPQAALARPGQAIDTASTSCAAETARVERAQAIPAHLLTAVSLAESGRWNGPGRVSLAWPWTVNAGGEGRFFDSKEAAVAEVKRLLKAGVRSIDVGCMQINLLHHGQAFASVEEAIEPRRNVEYAAQYLKAMHAVAKDWRQAAGYYHSTTPERSEAYMQKVVRLWDEQTGATAVARAEPRVRLDLALKPLMDSARIALVNERFKARREAERAELAGDPSRLRQTQLAAWRSSAGRDGRANLVATAEAAAKRRAELELERKTSLEAKMRADARARAAQRHRADLDFWRTHVSGSQPAAGEPTF